MGYSCSLSNRSIVLLLKIINDVFPVVYILVISNKFTFHSISSFYFRVDKYFIFKNQSDSLKMIMLSDNF